jgi:competence protein ComEC
LGQILQATREHSVLPQFLEGRDLNLIGCVIQVERLERGLRLWLTSNRLAQNSQPDTQTSPMAHYFNADLQLSYFYYGTADAQLPEIDVGYWLSVQVRLKQPRSYGNPQSFDYRAWALRHGIGAKGVIKHWQPMEKQACLTEPQRWLAAAREQLANAIDNRPLSVTSKALWQALSLGERRGLEQSHWQVLNATGTSNLLVISGLHIGLVALGSYGLVLVLVRRLGCQSQVGLRLAALVACLAGLIYTALADFAIPTQRAMIMLVCLLWGVLWGLEIGFIRRLGLAFLLTVATQPESIFSLGLWLSYGAVMVLGLSWAARGKQRLRQRLQALL